VYARARGVTALKRPALVLSLATVAVLLVALVLLVTRSGYRITGRPSKEPEPGSWYVDVQRYNQGVHGGMDCSVCHLEISLGHHPNPNYLGQNTTDLFDYQACASCHPQEYEYYQLGVHAEVMSGARESESEYPAPTCGHCHDPHYRQVLSRLEVIDAQVQICGQCHPSELETYLENYHGKTAVDLDFEDSASCADCHGSHQVLALDQPQEALQACLKCHPEATENMAGFLIHAEETLSPEADAAHARESVLLFVVQLFFVILTASVLAFFYGHTFLWLLRGLHERLRRR
jgi:hypothetical protein